DHKDGAMVVSVKNSPKLLSSARGQPVLRLCLGRIGLAIARRLAQDGAHVLVSSRKQANVDRTVSELQAESLSVSGLVCHVGKSEDRRRLVDMAVERYGGIDILVCNAAVNPFFGRMLDASEEVWDKLGIKILLSRFIASPHLMVVCLVTV
uniref:Dehydrogenase/reductase SDR family member 4 n=1 Tax=Naja naja TaxID=35670 RepID=A0A8C7E2R3_NAJNA